MNFKNIEEFKDIINLIKYDQGLNLCEKKLESLDGCPKEVENFNCRGNILTTLKGSPEIINGNFVCSNNNLTSLEYCPTKVKGNFDCRNNYITTLKGSPKIINGNFYCQNNNLKSLQFSPQIINKHFNCSNNLLITLKGRPKEINDGFYCENNPNLKNVKEQIIKYKIKAKRYYTDEGTFDFNDIENFFLEYDEKIKKINKYKNINFGLSL